MTKSILLLLLSNLLIKALLLLYVLPDAIALHPTNETDRLALMAFKERILEDPLGVMDSWNETSHFCDWRGVSCSKRHEGRVTMLSLPGQKLVGSLPPHIGNLSFMRHVNLTQNQFKGEIPQEVSRLFRLRRLDLSYNNFQGRIPTNLSSCSNLEYIDFNLNELTGGIPTDLGNLLNGLRCLYISGNQLTGGIPPWLGNVSSLEKLSLGGNNLNGNIPNELGRLANLEFLQIGQNDFSGKVPLSIFNLSLLQCFAVADNQLHGKLPSNIGSTLPNLELLYVDLNYFYGVVPLSLLNATRLEVLEMGSNNLSGVVPLNLGILKSLQVLSIHGNQLETTQEEGLGFIISLTNCSNLQRLEVSNNLFKGVLPPAVANLSTKLSFFNIATNPISGEIPGCIGNLVGLTILEISGTSVTGEIPSSIGKLKALSFLYLDSNKLAGSIPSSFGNITRLQRLILFDNNFSGPIPHSLGNCSQLQNLYLDGNKLNGNIPKQLFNLSGVLELSFEKNSLTGQLPLEVGNMTSLVTLYVQDNRLSGMIPSTLGDCVMLEILDMNNNMFEGDIPPSFSTLKSLKYLDVSRNNLSGEIPKFFQNFTLFGYLNLSFNNFVGNLPTGGPFGNASIVSVTGNQRLCGGIRQLGLPLCGIQGEGRKGKLHRRKVVVSVAISCTVLLIMVLLLVIFSYTRRTQRRGISAQEQAPEGFPLISYAELINATNGFSSSNLIGEGSFGSVYRGTFGPDGMSVAVKVLNLFQKGASKSFIAECEALKNIRHRNLIKIVTVCSSIDFKGIDFKALVYEFMQNGSLEGWLHPNREERAGGFSLSFIQRLNIAIDVACALGYLHDHCQPPIVHGDLKPSNVLLDEDMVAHVGDFGLASFLPSSSSSSQSNSMGIKGTIGYIAPEYGMNKKASKPGDVYGFGILLLEMITGKRPTNAVFKDGLGIHQLTKTSLPEGIMDIIDPSMHHEIQDAENPKARNRGISIRESLVTVVRVGVLCSLESPSERMEMKQVVAELNVVRDKFFSGRR